MIDHAPQLRHTRRGWDNNFFDHLAFVDCAFAVPQEGQPRPDDTIFGMSRQTSG